MEAVLYTLLIKIVPLVTTVCNQGSELGFFMTLQAFSGEHQLIGFAFNAYPL